MASFQYEALKMSDRAKVNGLINAGSEKEARELLREQELIPTKLQVVSDKQQGEKFNPVAAVMELVAGIGPKERITFTRNIGMMIRSGIPLTEALMYFENYVKNRKFRLIISRIRSDIMGGMTFSQALSRHKKLFNDVYVNVTKAGERSGELDQTMARLTDLMLKAEKLKMKIISASVYPCIVLVIVALVLLLMFTLVIPTFIDIYDKLGVPLPLITQIMFQISGLLRDQWYITFPLMGMSVFGIIKWFQSDTGKRLWDAFVLKIPVMNELVKFSQNSHFVSTFYVAFNAGIPITDALYLASNTVTHTQIHESLINVNQQIQMGHRLSSSLANTGYVPDIVLLMISNGEESGDLDKMLEASFEYLEDEIGHKVDILTSLMEPLMLMVVGVIVGFVALSIYLPLFSIYDFL
jgi:type II secretory pathway component PulF